MAHQKAIVEFLKERNFCALINSFPGSGKSFASLEAWNQLGRPRALILVPASVKKQWIKEVTTYFGQPLATCIDGTAEERRELWQENGLLIANPDLLVRDWPVPLKRPFELVVADECHLFNNPAAKRTKALKKLQAKYRVAMSGTPAPNALHELFSISDWIQPGILGKNFYEFRQRHCKVHPLFPSQIVGYYDEALLRKTFASLMYQVKRESTQEEMQLPELTVSTTNLSFTDGHLKDAYHSMRDQFLFELEAKTVTATNAVSKLLKLRQLIDYPQLFNNLWISPKEVWLQEHLKQLVKSRLVFFEFTEPCEQLALKYGALFITGHTSQAERQRQVEQFMRGEKKLLFATSAAGTGLNLQVADEVIFYGLPWSHAQLEQRYSRTWRKGRREAVLVTVPLVENSIDLLLWKTILDKKKSMDKMDAEELLTCFKSLC